MAQKNWHLSDKLLKSVLLQASGKDNIVSGGPFEPGVVGPLEIDLLVDHFGKQSEQDTKLCITRGRGCFCYMLNSTNIHSTSEQLRCCVISV